MNKFVVVALFLVIRSSGARPPPETLEGTTTTTTTTTEEPKEIIPILKDEREDPLNGDFKFHFQTGDGIDRIEEGDTQGTRTGTIKFPLPNGEIFELNFKAGPNGFQPESSFLPKAPVFPHPIPEHAQEQLRRHG